MAELFCIKNARVILRDRILENHAVLCRDGVIEAILPEAPTQEGMSVLDAEGKYLSAGFVDMHLHGGGGADFMDAGEETYATAIAAHLRHGTTSLAPTTLAAPTAHLRRAVCAYNKAAEDPALSPYLLGLHFEGPYLSAEQAGAQKPENIRAFTPEEYRELYALAKGQIVRWSVAPELPGAAEFAAFAKERGFAISIAHSNADFDTVEAAFAMGYTHVTHFYSGVSSVSRQKGFRVAGIVEAGYYLDGMDVEIIADGCHLPPSLLKLILKTKGVEHVALVTDSMRAAGQDVQESFLGSAEDPLPVVIEDGVAKLLSREAFGGSIATADRLIRTMRGIGVPLCDAVAMMTENPVRMLGIKKKIGRIAVGYAADLCVFDENVEIAAVVKSGRRVV